jgi:hypothetical protein
MDYTDLKVKGYTLGNPDKVDRAINGSPDDKGMPIGGIAKEDGTYDADALLAEYDRLGGYIRKGDDKVKTGSFYDFKNRRPHTKAEVKFIFKVNGEFITVDADKETPGIVKAAKKQVKAKKVTKKVTKKK